MIGLSDSNISIILQLASCSPPGLPLASNWPAFWLQYICNPSYQDSFSFITYSATAMGAALCHAAFSSPPKTLQHHGQALLETCHASEISRTSQNEFSQGCDAFLPT
jgi:hypothetical protein